jgi:dethiobiotin synthetase
MSAVVFITGTDTGVGKTLLTALLLCHLRQAGRCALAMKPFATGNRADATLLDRVQDHALPLAQLNPFFFPLPVAPLVAARQAGRTVSCQTVAGRIRRTASRGEILLVEGCGGLLTPLGPRFTLLDLMRSVPSTVIVAAPNRVGVLNHVMLTKQALLTAGVSPRAIVLMGTAAPDVSCHTNELVLRELLPACRVLSIPYLGAQAARLRAVRKNVPLLNRQLRLLAGSLTCPERSSKVRAHGDKTGSHHRVLRGLKL